MLKRVFCALVLSLQVTSVAWGDSTLEQLTTLAVPAGADYYYCVQSSTDYKCTLDQIRQWSNVLIAGGAIDGTPIGGSSPAAGDFTTVNTTGVAGIMESTPLNTLDVGGNVVIGGTYSGAQTAPADGLLVEGNVSFGATAPATRNHFTLQDTAAENNSSVLFAQITSADYANSYGLYFNHIGAATSAGAYNKYGLYTQTLTASGGAFNNTGSLFGGFVATYHRGDATLSNLYGLYLSVGTNDGGGDSTGTLTSAYGLYVTGAKTASSTITTETGVYLKNLNATNVFSLRIGGSTCSTSCYDIYAEDASFFNYFAGDVGIGTNVPTEALDVNANTMRLRTARTPATSGEACNAGEIAWDTGYIYVCVSSNTWKRATLNAF